MKKTTAELVLERPSEKELKNKQRHHIYVVLDNVRSLQNVGLVFRLCDALLVDKLFLTGITGYPPLGDNDPRPSNTIEHAYNQIAKTGIKLVPHVPWQYRASVTDVLSELKGSGVQIVAVEQTTTSVNFRDFNYQLPVALVLGHERLGVDDQVLGMVDATVEVPMFGIGNSLNIATALAVVGYDLVSRTPDPTGVA